MAFEEIDLKKQIFERPVSQQELYHLLSLYASLEITDYENPFVDDGAKPEIKETNTGWIIHDYGNLIRTALPRMGLGTSPRKEGDEDEDEEGEGGGGVTPGGTIIWQCRNTAQEVALMVCDRWETIDISAGFYGLQRALWISIQGLREQGKKVSLEGFEPTDEDWVVYHYVQTLAGGAAPKEIPQIGSS